MDNSLVKKVWGQGLGWNMFKNDLMSNCPQVTHTKISIQELMSAKERATRDHSWVPSEYNQIHSCQLKTSLLGSFCASLNMRDVSTLCT